VAHNLGYARISTADQDPRLQLDALAVGDCLKIYTDTASGTKADRPQWNACLADLRPGDTLIIWNIDRLGRNLRDLIDIVTTLQTRGVGVRSLTNGIVDTTTAHGTFVFGIFALMAEYEAALIKERTQAGLAAARARGRTGGSETQDDPRSDQQGSTHVRRAAIHHGRDRPVLRRHPDDDLPQHHHQPDRRELSPQRHTVPGQSSPNFLFTEGEQDDKIMSAWGIGLLRRRRVWPTEPAGPRHRWDR